MAVKIRMVKKELYYIELSDTRKHGISPVLVPLQSNPYPIINYELVKMNKAEIKRKGFDWFNTAVDDPANPMHPEIVHLTDLFKKEIELGGTDKDFDEMVKESNEQENEQDD